MKNKSKVIVGLSALLAVAAGSAATGTYAWFTTTRTATASLQSVGVYAQNDSLNVSGTKMSGFEGAIGETITVAGFSGSTKGLTDVSGDGVNMYRPEWDVDDTERTTATGIATLSDYCGSDPLSGYLRFKLHFSTNGAKLNVYLDKNSTLSYLSATSTYTNVNDATTPISEDAITGALAATSPTSIQQSTLSAAATRISFKGNDSHYTVWQPCALGYKATDTFNYLKKTDVSTDTAYTVANYKEKDATGTDTGYAWKVGQFGGTIKEGLAVDESTTKDQLVAANVDATGVDVVVTVWVEGTSRAAVSNAIGGSVKLDLKFDAIQAPQA
jgi:hypothetical protein